MVLVGLAGEITKDYNLRLYPKERITPALRVAIKKNKSEIICRVLYDSMLEQAAEHFGLELDPDEPPRMGSDWMREEVHAITAEISRRGVHILRDVGWIVPESLPQGFMLVDAFAIGEGDGSSLHLLYSDGLYALSVYEQEGRLNVASATEQGAERVTLGGMEVLRWPGGEPATYLWSGEGMTFTVVTDAPPDAVAAALSAFPAERQASIVDRLRRGAVRVVDSLRSMANRSPG
jgi:hypothetical protein